MIRKNHAPFVLQPVQRLAVAKLGLGEKFQDCCRQQVGGGMPGDFKRLRIDGRLCGKVSAAA